MVTMISLAEALTRVLAAPCEPALVETVALALAHGRHLAAAVVADAPWPATDRSAMDGFALASGRGLPAGTELPVVGQSLAGHPFAGSLAPGQAIRIMTGAVVPAGADTVVPVEQTSGYQGQTVMLQQDVRPGQHVRRAGSELVAGTTVLAPGTRLFAAELGALAVLGVAQVPVCRRPRVAIVATGDEVVPVEQAPAPHQVRESNSVALWAQVHECGGEAVRLGIAPDEPAGLRALLQQALDCADVVLTIGGVSAGTHDLVHGTLQQLGVQQVFHGIALKPGKPTFFGTRQGDGAQFVFGLPGNPASCFTVFDLLVRPLLQRLCGQLPGPPQARAQLGGVPQRQNAREQAVPCSLQLLLDGRAQANALPPSPSGDPFGLLLADGYALLPAAEAPLPGEPLPFVPYSAGALHWLP